MLDFTFDCLNCNALDIPFCYSQNFSKVEILRPYYIQRRRAHWGRGNSPPPPKIVKFHMILSKMCLKKAFTCQVIDMRKLFSKNIAGVMFLTLKGNSVRNNFFVGLRENEIFADKIWQLFRKQPVLVIIRQSKRLNNHRLLTEGPIVCHRRGHP